MSAIFISHSSKNNDAAREMKEHLAAQGHVGVFLDFDPADGIPAGRDWEQELYQQIRSSRAVIVLCSKPLMESRWCFAEITHARALGKHLFPVKIEECNLDAVLTDRQVVDLTTEKEAGYQRLWTGLKAAGLDPADAFDWDPTREPYPGLVTFEERDAAVYFGRDDEIHDGLDRLNRVRRLQVSGFAMVTGASGCGKSSLVRAGLVPRLRQDPQRWIVTDPFRPRQDVVRELSFSLSAAFRAAGKPVDPQVIRDRLSAALVTGAPQGNPLRDMAHELRSLADQSEARVLMIVDQFEELFGKDAQPSEAFLRLLRDAANGVDSPLIVLGTIRSDLIAEFRSSEPLRGLEFEVLAIGPMSPQGLRDVILGPAELAGVTFEEGLIDEMAHDASLGDALPLLAFALRELHDRFGADREFAREEYRNGLGGLEGALRTRAEETLAAEALDPRLESQLRLAMLQMVRLDTTGRRSRQIARWTDLPAEAHPVLERLVAARLLVSGDALEWTRRPTGAGDRRGWRADPRGRP